MDLGTRLMRATIGAVSESVVTALWYVLLAGLTWLAFEVLFHRWFRRRKINPRTPTVSQIGREFVQSLRSILVFGGVTAAVLIAAGYGHTRLYGNRTPHGWAWFFVSIALAVVVHDTWFYWTHRVMHHPRLFRLIHRTHHRSLSPSPWAAYSFGLGEALVQAGIGPLVVCTIPMHEFAFLLFMGWQILFNVFGHCGYEIFPRWFLRTWLGKFLNTPTHHAQHHEKFDGNYGLYFNLWDRLMGTNHPDYEERFAQVTTRGA